MNRAKTDAEHATSVLAALGDLVLLVDDGGRVVECATRGIEQLGHSRESIIGSPIGDLLHPDDGWLTEANRTALGEGGNVLADRRVADADGGWVLHRFNITGAESQMLVASGRCVEESDSGEEAGSDDRSEAELSQLALLKTLADITDDVFAVTDERGYLQYTNDAARRIHGEQQLIGSHISEFIHPDDTGFAALIATPRQENSRVDGRVLAVTADGSPVMLSVSTVFDGKTRQWFTVERDISGLVQREAEMDRLNEDLHRRATTDALTGVANRAALNDWLERAESDRTTYALLLLDMDDFKSVNDTFGHAAGDDLLTQVATRLVSATRPGDMVARLGGDEFVIVIAEASDGQAALVADRVVDAVSKPYDIDGHSLARSCSVGVAIHGPDDTPTRVLRRADRAAYEAKHIGRSRYVVFDAPDGEAESTPDGTMDTTRERPSS